MILQICLLREKQEAILAMKKGNIWEEGIKKKKENQKTQTPSQVRKLMIEGNKFLKLVNKNKEDIPKIKDDKNLMKGIWKTKNGMKWHNNRKLILRKGYKNGKTKRKPGSKDINRWINKFKNKWMENIWIPKRIKKEETEEKGTKKAVLTVDTKGEERTEKMIICVKNFKRNTRE